MGVAQLDVQGKRVDLYKVRNYLYEKMKLRPYFNEATPHILVVPYLGNATIMFYSTGKVIVRGCYSEARIADFLTSFEGQVLELCLC